MLGIKPPPPPVLPTGPTPRARVDRHARLVQFVKSLPPPGPLEVPGEVLLLDPGEKVTVRFATHPLNIIAGIADTEHRGFRNTMGHTLLLIQANNWRLISIESGWPT